MATEYFPAPDTVALMVNERLKTHHPLMFKHGVRIGVLFAQNDKGPAVKLHGAACNATIGVVAHRDRVTKRYDAEMVISEKNWEGFSHRQRQALIAHELAHLELVQKKNKKTGEMAAQFDAGGRPKLKTRPGDWDAGDGFALIVAEFGTDAIEYENMRTCWKYADQARELGLPAPDPSLLDELKDEIKTVEVVVEGETWREVTFDGVKSAALGLVAGGLAARFKERADDGDKDSTGPRSGVDETPDYFDERIEGPSYDERTGGI